MSDVRRNHRDCDILMITEDTYPFVRSEAASWVANIIQGLPNYRFGIIFIDTKSDKYTDYAYPLPENLIFLESVYLFEPLVRTMHKSPSVHPEALTALKDFHANLQQSAQETTGLAQPLPSIDQLMTEKKGFNVCQFMHSEQAWSFIEESYRGSSSDPSFINYFWNIRHMHLPLWNLQAVLASLHNFKLIHPIATGYAGLLAVMLKQAAQKPIILSEHGIYTKEKDIELFQKPMMQVLDPLLGEQTALTYQHPLWLRFYRSLARMCYAEAWQIISLYDAAKKQQILDGAPEDKCRIIANGVPIEKFRALTRPLHEPISKTICFAGRFVRIKEVKTLIRTMHMVSSTMPEAAALIKIVGELDEDYLQECKAFIDFLNLSEHIQFMEEGDMQDVLAQAAVLVLPSISETMPFILLEALAAGIPVLATDMGACREILLGHAHDDPCLAPAGEIISLATPELLAQAILKFLQDETLWRRTQQAALLRSEAFNIKNMLNNYQHVYQKAMIWQA